jgi:hypothetical protein
MPEMPDFEVNLLFETSTVAVRNVHCSGTCRHRGAEECVSATHLVFPYRGTYLRHVGSDQSVADANHVLLFNAAESYQVSHPVTGGDASLVLALSEPLLRELAPRPLLNKRDELGFRLQSLRIDPRAQALVALLRHSLQNGTIEALEAESLLLSVASRSLAPRTSRESGATYAKRRLVDRVKLLLASDVGRRCTHRWFSGLSDPGVPAGRRPAALPLSVIPAPRARPRPHHRLRKRVHTRARPWLFQP